MTTDLNALPAFDPDNGRLPPGEHVATWNDVIERFGWNDHRRRLLDGLAEAIDLLASAGCQTLWLNGSFITAKDEPNDFDACWDTDGVDLDVLDPVMTDLLDHCSAQKARFGGELYPNRIETRSGRSFVEYFQHEQDGSRKGIVVVHLTKRDAP